MGTFVPSDIAVREAIRDDVRKNLCVEAGAGTGKTTVLVDRIVKILSTGHARVEQLAVITFTEKAAAELSGRVRQGLEDALTAAVAGDECARLEQAILGLNHAHIETIHAFAAGLLRERPIEARLDPGFTVLDVLPSKMAFEAAWGDWLTEQMAIEPPDGPPTALVNALNLGLKFEHVREAAERLYRFRDVLPLSPYEREDIDIDRALADMRPHVDALRIEPRMRDLSDPAYLAMPEFVDLYEGLVSMRGEAQSLRRAIATTETPSFYLGNADRWHDKKDCKAAKAEMTAIVAVIKQCRSEMRHNAVADLVEWVTGFIAYYEDRRRDDGAADFDDLLIWARNLMRDKSEVRAYFHEKYRCVLVDEFQDTDPIQAEMIVRLCEEGEPATNWREARLRDGSLFVVGDPKQSIYRFRRADITMYDDVKRHVFRDGVREITQNFRSSQPIIEWVNRTFAPLFVEQAGVQPRYVALEHHPEYVCQPEEALTLVRGVVQPPPPDASTRAPTNMRRCEAGAIAAIIADAVRDRSWRVRTEAPGESRPATYGDITILIPSRTELPLYEEALAGADVPHRHEGGRTFFARQEVRELIALLRAIDDPSDQIAAIAALRSAAFGSSDEELLLHRTNGGWFSHVSVPDRSTGAVPDALRAIHRLAEGRFKQTLPELVRTVLDQTRLVEFSMLQPQGEQVAANLLKMVDHARAYAAAQPGGLRGFVRWLKEHLATDADAADAEVSEDSDDVVRIVTIHASKGLEFPVVVFANMNTDRVDRTNAMADRREHVLHIKLGKRDEEFRTPGYDDAETDDKMHALAQERRLLYVAATRARDRLVVPFFDDGSRRKSTDEPKTLNQWLCSVDADEGAVAAPESTAATHLPVWRRPLATPARNAPERVVAARTAWRRDRDALRSSAAAGLRIITASSLKADWEAPFTEIDRVRRGRAAEFGSAVHALLERVDLRRGDGAGIDALAVAAATEAGMPDRVADLAAIARNALDSAIMRRVRASLAAGGRVLPEVGFSAPTPNGGLTEGRIDLLFEEGIGAGRGLIVVDYKTDNVSRADADIRANKLYYKQAQVYAWAAQRATGMPVREVVFLFARIMPVAHESMIAVDANFIASAETLVSTAALDVLG